MTNDVISTDVQSLEIASGLIELYELELGTGSNNTLYFHSANDLDSSITATVNGAVNNSTSVTLDSATTNSDIKTGALITGTGISGSVTVSSISNTSLTLSSSQTLSDNTTLTFENSERELIFDGNTYISLPIMMDGVEKSAEGAQSRPKLTFANVESILKTGSQFKDQMEDGVWDAVVNGEALNAADFKVEHLVGARLVRRKTLEKYCGSGVTAYEFGKETFIIDRISAKNLLFVEVELASPVDMGGIKVPGRLVIGKYCPWLYQGYYDNAEGSACYWKKNEQIADLFNTKYTFYFTGNDEPLIFSSFLSGTASTNGLDSITVTNGGNTYTSAPTVVIGSEWSNSASYTALNQVFYGNNVYTIDADGTGNGSGNPTHTSGTQTVAGLTVSYAGVKAVATATVTAQARTATVNGAVNNSTNVTLDAGTTNVDISIGDIVTGTGISGTVTVSSKTSNIAVVLSSAQTISDNVTLTFTSNKVTNVKVTTNGSGYGLTLPAITFTGGGGSGATASATFTGKVWVGAYSASTTYLPGEYVSHGGLYWRAESEMAGSSHPSAPQEGSSNWQIVRTYTNWSSSTSYTVDTASPPDFRKNSYVRHDNTVWRAVKAQSSSDYKTPGTDSSYWVRGDACGKLLKSCKIRYQAVPKGIGTTYNTNAVPHTEVNSFSSLPFGGFPGSRKFR